MPTLFLSHPDCLAHETGLGHPERPDRLRAVEKVLSHESFGALKREQAPLADRAVIERIHPARYVDAIFDAIPDQGLIRIDPDTVLSPGSLNAALRSAGAAVRAVDAVMSGETKNAFIATRPPGHHAEPARAMGFCLFNNVAIGAMHARAKHGITRVAVVDFDVHHGNGTQAAFWSDRNLFYASTHQMPLFPGTGKVGETGVGNIFNAPLSSGDDGEDLRAAFETRILPSLDAFRPELLIVSAGFDAHRDDPLASLNMVEADFDWATRKLVDAAEKHTGGRLVSVLEGGYDLTALARSTAAHVRVLMEAAA